MTRASARSKCMLIQKPAHVNVHTTQITDIPSSIPPQPLLAVLHQLISRPEHLPLPLNRDRRARLQRRIRMRVRRAAERRVPAIVKLAVGDAQMSDKLLPPHPPDGHQPTCSLFTEPHPPHISPEGQTTKATRRGRRDNNSRSKPPHNANQ